MLVADSNEVSGITRRDSSRLSPVLHPAIHHLLEGMGVRDDLDLRVLYARREPSTEEFRTEGSITYVPVRYQPCAVAGPKRDFLGRILALLRELRSLQPQLVHAQGSERECGLAAGLCRFPSILTLHGDLEAISRAVQAPIFSYLQTAAVLQRIAVSMVKGLHCLSEHTLEHAGRRKRAKWLIPNAVGRDFLQISRNECECPSVVCIADIAPWKNPTLLLQASDRLVQEFPGSNIHFFGYSDPQTPYASAFQQELARRPWCIAHGQTTEEGIADALSRATCSVLPSLMENCPLAVLESMAAGVPVLGARVGGIPDLIDPGRTGFLFDPNDPDDLAECLIKIHRDCGQRQLMGQLARQSMLARHTPEIVAHAHLTMYHELLR